MTTKNHTSYPNKMSLVYIVAVASEKTKACNIHHIHHMRKLKIGEYACKVVGIKR